MLLAWRGYFAQLESGPVRRHSLSALFARQGTRQDGAGRASPRDVREITEARAQESGSAPCARRRGGQAGWAAQTLIISVSYWWMPRTTPVTIPRNRKWLSRVSGSPRILRRGGLGFAFHTRRISGRRFRNRRFPRRAGIPPMIRNIVRPLISWSKSPRGWWSLWPSQRPTKWSSEEGPYPSRF